MFTRGYWRQLDGTRRVLEGLVIQDVGDRLAARLPGPRNEGADNAIFQALTQDTKAALGRRDYMFAINLFNKCFGLALEYERQAGCEVHKGAMTFNVALAYLGANDFSAAMHYLELAQRETRTTKGDAGWGIYEFELFQHNFWKTLDRYEENSPLTFYFEWWSTAFGSGAAQQDWGHLSEHSKLLYIIVNAERISYSRLEPRPGWPISESFSLAYWNLIADLSRILETELRERNMAAKGLRAGVLSDINNSPLSGFKTEVTRLHAAEPINTTSDYNQRFPAYHTAITDPTRPRETRIAAAALFAGATRNQVQHQVDKSMVIFTDRESAIFTADVLLSLCCIDRWAKP
jgi:hypothetical protein